MKIQSTPENAVRRSRKIHHSDPLRRALAVVVLAFAVSLSSASAQVLFNDGFSTNTSADYATGGAAAGGGGPGSLSIPGGGTATVTEPNGGFGSYFGFGRSLGIDVLGTVGDQMSVSLTFSLSALSTDTGVLALYAGNGTSATTSQSPFGTNLPTVGTSFTPGGTSLVLQGIGNTAASANVIDYSGGTVYGGQQAVGALTATTSYTLVMDITRVAGATPTYTFATTLNGATLNDTLSITGLDSINQVGLRWYNPGAPSPDFFTPTVISMDSFSATVIPEPSAMALAAVGVATLMLLRRKRAASEK